jgi:hypothetical protein
MPDPAALPHLAARRWTQRPVVALGFLGILVSAQAAALFTQFQRGFRPFAAAPTRVPLSWDMFSIPIVRCGIEWTPELPIGRGYPSLRSMAPLLEWDPVYNTAQDYLDAAYFGCRLRHAPTHARLHCMTPAGPFDHAFDCP